MSATGGLCDGSHPVLVRQLVVFFSLAYCVAWLFFGSLALSRAGLGWLPFDLSLPVMIVLGSFAPSIASFATIRLTEGRWPAIAPLALKPLFVGFVIAPILIAGTFAVIPAAVLTTSPWSTIRWSVLFSASVYNLSTLIGGPLGEEPGWRSYALPRLEELFGPWKASLLLGVLWAGWHLPLFLCKSWSSTDFPTYLLITTAFTFLMTFLFNLSGGSVVTAIATHAFFNTVSRWLGGLLADATVRERPSPELILGLSGAAVAFLLMLASGGKLAYGRSTAK